MSHSFINSILQQSLKTFKNKHVPAEIFKTNLQQLKTMLDTLTAEDVNLDPALLEDNTWNDPQKAPMTYIELYQDTHVNIGMFVLKPGSTLPLHDHPKMHGLLKVIAGEIKIANYSIRSSNGEEIIAERHEDIVADATSEACILKPRDHNLHEIYSIEGAAAFLDVLAPPYDVLVPEYGPRKCSYYAVEEEWQPDLFRLREIKAPSWFWSDHDLYTGPKLRRDDSEETA